MEKDRKLQIIKAAEKRFVKHGLNKTTLDEVARDLRIGKSTLYHYFDSKEHLYFSTVRWQTDQYLSALSEVFKKELPPKENLKGYILFKETVFDNYKLILTLMLNVINEKSFDEEIGILEDLYKKEANCLKEVILNVNFVKESLNFTFPIMLVHYSWGMLLNNILLSKTVNGAAADNKECLDLLIEFMVK